VRLVVKLPTLLTFLFCGAAIACQISCGPAEFDSNIRNAENEADAVTTDDGTAEPKTTQQPPPVDSAGNPPADPGGTPTETTPDGKPIDPCNLTDPKTGIRIAYDGKRLEIHGTAGNDTLQFRAAPGLEKDTIMLNGNGRTFFLKCPGQLAVFGYAGNDTFDLSALPAATGVSVDGGT
jgi:hypothetical protein